MAKRRVRLCDSRKTAFFRWNYSNYVMLIMWMVLSIKRNWRFMCARHLTRNSISSATVPYNPTKTTSILQCCVHMPSIAQRIIQVEWKANKKKMLIIQRRTNSPTIVQWATAVGSSMKPPNRKLIWLLFEELGLRPYRCVYVCVRESTNVGGWVWMVWVFCRFGYAF